MYSIVILMDPIHLRPSVKVTLGPMIAWCATRIVSRGNVEATGGHIVIPSLMYMFPTRASNAFQKQS